MDLNERIEALCEAAISERVFPGCSVAYVRQGQTAELGFGRLTYDATSQKVHSQTLYDVASITKSVPTGSMMLKLVEARRIGLDDKVIDYLPELQNDHRELILIRHLLTYTVTFELEGGVAALARKHPNAVIEQLMRVPLVSTPGTGYWYTNGPAILMGMIIERVYGRPLDEAAQDELFIPLGMMRTTFEPSSLEAAEIAPSEISAGEQILGRVHDESAWAITKSGGRSGAAGLFSTASDLLRYSQMLLGQGGLDGVRIFNPETIKLMHTDQLSELPDRAGLGWELLPARLRGTKAGEQTFGKTGFTGCVMMLEPEMQAALVHLSNATYPKRPDSREPINAFRRELADLVFGG